MKLDTSKLSNKDDLVALLAVVVLFAMFGFVFYLSATANTFASGFISSTIIWKWRDWYYVPVDRFLEAHWPSDKKGMSD